MKRFHKALAVLCAGVVAVGLASCASSGDQVNEAYASSVQASASIAIESAIASVQASASASIESAAVSVIASALMNTTASTTSTAATAATTQAVTIAVMGDAVTLGNWEITVDSVEVKDKIMAAGGYGSYTPDKGNKYVVIHMTVKNTGKEMDSFLPSFSSVNDVRADVLYQDDYSFSASQLLGESDDLHDSSVNPLSQKTGYIAFEIAEDAANSGELELRLTQGEDEARIALGG